MKEIRYRLQNQNYGTLYDFSPIIVENDIMISFENATNGMVAKIVSDAPYFCEIKDGVCQFKKSALVGKISVCVVSQGGTIPCTGLVAMKRGDEILLIPDATEILQRVSNTEREISRLIRKQNDIDEKYADLKNRIQKLFEGYNI